MQSDKAKKKLSQIVGAASKLEATTTIERHANWIGTAVGPKIGTLAQSYAKCPDCAGLLARNLSAKEAQSAPIRNAVYGLDVDVEIQRVGMLELRENWGYAVSMLNRDDVETLIWVDKRGKIVAALLSKRLARIAIGLADASLESAAKLLGSSVEQRQFVFDWLAVLQRRG